MNPSDIPALAARAGLEGIWQTVAAGDRLDAAQAAALLESHDILALGAIADCARARAVGDEVYFISNRHINHTNVCRNRCLFCAFSHDEGDADAFTLSVDEVVERRVRPSPRAASARSTSSAASTPTCPSSTTSR